MRWNSCAEPTDYDKGAAMIQEKYNIPLVLVTMGKDRKPGILQRT